MTFIKEIQPARQIDKWRSFEAVVKTAYIAKRKNAAGYQVTVMQSNANALDSYWFADSEQEAAKGLIDAGYILQ